MSAVQTTRSQVELSLIKGLGALAICLSGCGGSSTEMQLSDQARRIIDRRKVDVEQRPKQSKSSNGRPNKFSGQQRK